jgi:uncharacterized membrane protein
MKRVGALVFAVILVWAGWAGVSYWQAHTRAVRECRCVVSDGSDDGDETFDGCVSRRIAEIRAAR